MRDYTTMKFVQTTFVLIPGTVMIRTGVKNSSSSVQSYFLQYIKPFSNTTGPATRHAASHSCSQYLSLEDAAMHAISFILLKIASFFVFTLLSIRFLLTSSSTYTDISQEDINNQFLFELIRSHMKGSNDLLTVSDNLYYV